LPSTQVLASRTMPAWRVLAWFKFTEMVVQLRPKALWRTYLQPDGGLRHAMRWYTQMGRRVWPYEVFNFLFRDKRVKRGPTVAEFWGASQEKEEESMVVAPRSNGREAACLQIVLRR